MDELSENVTSTLNTSWINENAIWVPFLGANPFPPGRGVGSRTFNRVSSPENF